MRHAYEQKIDDFRDQTLEYDHRRSGGYWLTGKASQAAKEGATACINGDELEVEGVEGIKHILNATDVEDADTIDCMAVRGLEQCVVYGFSDTTGNEDIEDEGFFLAQDREGNNYLLAAPPSELHNAMQEVGMENAVEKPENLYDEVAR